MKLKQSDSYYSEGCVAGAYGAPAEKNPYTGTAGELWENGRQFAMLENEFPAEPWVEDDEAFHRFFWLALVVAVVAVFGAGVFVGWSL